MIAVIAGTVSKEDVPHCTHSQLNRNFFETLSNLLTCSLVRLFVLCKFCSVIGWSSPYLAHYLVTDHLTMHVKFFRFNLIKCLLAQTDTHARSRQTFFHLQFDITVWSEEMWTRNGNVQSDKDFCVGFIWHGQMIDRCFIVYFHMVNCKSYSDLNKFQEQLILVRHKKGGNNGLNKYKMNSWCFA